jgi:hypothetical protein
MMWRVLLLLVLGYGNQAVQVLGYREQGLQLGVQEPGVVATAAALAADGGGMEDFATVVNACSA